MRIALGALILFAGPALGQATPAIDLPMVARPPEIHDLLPMERPAVAGMGLARVDTLVQRWPADGAPVSERTVAYLGHDRKNVYFAFLCFDGEAGRVQAHAASRDRIPDEDDTVAINIDTFGDRRWAYGFQANAAGAQNDAIWSEGRTWDFSFDAVWWAEGRRTEEGYVVLMTLPLRTLRFRRAELQQWGLFLYRGIPRKSEESYWPAYSTHVQGRLGQAGRLSGLAGVDPGRNIEAIPYASFRAARDAAGGSAGHDREAAVGVDLKAVLRQSLVLDATVNPDFSQVESDEPQVTVNRRFEVFFPEKRPFFIENASYFETPIRLLFTRRVVDPRAGLRLTGKTGPYAIGAFMANDQTESATVSFARISRDLGGESNLGLVMSRRALAGRSNTVTGVDGQWRLGPNWLASAQAVTSATSTEDRRLAGPAYNAALRRAGRHLAYSVAYDDLSPGFRADSGFIERVDVRQLTQNATLRLRPGRPWLIDYGPDLVLQRLWAHDGRPLDAVGTATFTIDAAGPTALSVAYTGRSELLRPAEVPGLVDALRFDDHATTVSVRSYAVRRLSFRAAWTWGDAINLAPAAGRPLATAASTLLDAGLTWRPAAAVGLELAVLQTSLAEPGIGERGVIFRDRILRTKATYQVLRALSVRGIAQYESVAADPTRSSLAPRRSLLLDLLAAYVPQPGTAVYVGYGDSLQGPQETLAGRWVSASRQLFLKLSVRKPL